MGIGPSTKETSLHHFRDPLLEVVSSDPEIDLMGIIIVGTPDAGEEKLLVGTRAAVWAECMRADGAIVSSDGWGNSDVDYTNTVYQLGIRGIPVTGLNFSGTMAQFLLMSTMASRYSLVTTNWAMVPLKLRPVTGMPRIPSWYTVLV